MNINDKVKIIVRTESLTLWWGIYGLCEKAGWEDLELFYENKERIGAVCLQSKGYLRAGLTDLRNDPDEQSFVEAVEKYLVDDKCHYWYYYSDGDDEDFFEVPYLAPKNDKGVKPRFMDIWHPDTGIGISTIETGIKTWAKGHLGIETCEVHIENGESLEESLKSFKENENLLARGSIIKVEFSEEVIEELSRYWKKPNEEVLKKLQDAISPI